MARAFAIAAALVFTAFLSAQGIPTLRHDWTWPVDRGAVPSFIIESVGGWIPTGLGALNAHPTSYVIALPMAAIMGLFGPFIALVVFSAVIGYVCMRASEALAQRWGCTPEIGVAIGFFALFNPWVYNEIVAGHLVMVLAYAGLIGLLAEMLRGKNASAVRLALWLALIELQLQFFILAMAAVIVFACATRKWLAPIAGIVLILPSMVGLAGESSTIVKTPYVLDWQANQSVTPAALAGLGGYFAGYSDRLGLAAAIAVWMMLGLALAGAILARRSRAALAVAAAAVVLFVAVTGVHGPLGHAYEWIVRRIPESGVFRELYDLAGMLAVLIATLACAAMAAFPKLRYVALAVAFALPVTWLVAPPSQLWVGAARYPHPLVRAPAFTRVVLMPPFQPLRLRVGGGDGADPDAHAYSQNVTPLNEYFPSYPVDMALAQYERDGDVASLRALGVSQIVQRPWLSSISNGSIGLAASSLVASSRRAAAPTGLLGGVMPLVSRCDGPRIVPLARDLSACEIFFGDAAGEYPAVQALRSVSGSIDSRTDWIDARLAFASVPELAQGVGGVLTQSRVPFPVEPRTFILLFVRGTLENQRGAVLDAEAHGSFHWISIPGDTSAVRCAGLCELVAQTAALPPPAVPDLSAAPAPLSFHKLAPWLYVVGARIEPSALLRLNERYDPGWVAIAGGRLARHLRVDMAVNGWQFRDSAAGPILLLQVTSLLQMLGEVLGIACVLWLLKALSRDSTKRARP
jgi:hypothetical protein